MQQVIWIVLPVSFSISYLLPSLPRVISDNLESVSVAKHHLIASTLLIHRMDDTRQQLDLENTRHSISWQLRFL